MEIFITVLDVYPAPFFQAVAYVITGNFELLVVTKLAILDV